MTFPFPLRKSSAPTQVVLVQDHDEAYDCWKGLGVKKRVLVHLDAHIDFEWIAAKNPLTLLQASSRRSFQEAVKNPYGWSMSTPHHQNMHLGNYLHDALQDEMIGIWYWVVPDTMWQSAEVRKRLWNDLLDYYRLRTGPMEAPTKIKNGFKTSFFEVPTFIGPLSSLPEFEEPVLLNIDADYLTTHFFHKIPKPEFLRKQIPWIWPDDLAARLKDKGISSDVVTISYSVNGGYTPIAFKFFGEALKNLFEGSPLPDAYKKLKAFFLLNRSASPKKCLNFLNSFRGEGDFETARLYQRTFKEFDLKAIAAARATFRECAELDAEFLSSYNSNARFYESCGQFHEALQEYAIMKEILPDSFEIFTGQARCFTALNQNDRARAKCLHILERQPDHAPSLFLMGKLCLAEKKFPQAVNYLKRCLEAGSRSVTIKILLGECFYELKQFAEAKDVLRQALGAGGHFPVTYFLLAKTYWKLSYRKKSAELFLEWSRLAWRRFYGA